MARPSKNIWQLKDDSERRGIVTLVLLYGTGGMIDRWYAQFPLRHSGDDAKDKQLIRDATRKCNPLNQSHCSQKWKDEFSAQKCLVSETRIAALERAVTHVIAEVEADLDDIKHTEIESSLDLLHQQQAKTLIVDRILAFLDRLRGNNDSDATGLGDNQASPNPTTFKRVKEIFQISKPESLDG